MDDIQKQLTAKIESWHAESSNWPGEDSSPVERAAEGDAVVEETCRTCESMSMVMKCAHEWTCEEEGSRACDEHKPRETPLLVDEFAEVVSAMIDAMTGPWYVYRKMLGTQEVNKEVVRKAGELVTRAYVLLGRHQKEVGDA